MKLIIHDVPANYHLKLLLLYCCVISCIKMPHVRYHWNSKCPCKIPIWKWLCIQWKIFWHKFQDVTMPYWKDYSHDCKTTGPGNHSTQNNSKFWGPNDEELDKNDAGPSTLCTGDQVSKTSARTATTSLKLKPCQTTALCMAAVKTEWINTEEKLYSTLALSLLRLPPLQIYLTRVEVQSLSLSLPPERGNSIWVAINHTPLTYFDILCQNLIFGLEFTIERIIKKVTEKNCTYKSIN